jgi:hypothetical protein
LLDGFKNYNNKTVAEHNFHVIRQEIYKQFKDEIIKDLNQDLIKENKDLNEDHARIRELKILQGVSE